MLGGQPRPTAWTVPPWLLNPAFVRQLVGDTDLQVSRTVLVRADCVQATRGPDVLGVAASAALGDPSGVAVELAGDALDETLRSADEEVLPGL